MILTLTGTNSFMLNEELTKLINAFVNEYGDLAYEKLDAEEASAERLIETAQSLPFLAPKKLVIMRSPSSQKMFAEVVEHVLKSVPDTTDLILVEPKLDKRSAYYKVLKAKTEYKEYFNLDAQELSKWIVQYTKNQDGEINLSDARYLVERAGQNQQLVANELDKLILFSPKINKQTIDLLVEPTPQSTIFELLDAAFAGSSKRVVKLYKEQRALKVEPQQIIAMLAWQLHILAIIKTAKGKTASQIAGEAKISPYVVDKSMVVASKVSWAQLKELINKALKLDVRLKSRSINADDALQEYLLTIA